MTIGVAKRRSASVPSRWEVYDPEKPRIPLNIPAHIAKKHAIVDAVIPLVDKDEQSGRSHRADIAKQSHRLIAHGPTAYSAKIAVHGIATDAWAALRTTA